LLRNIRNLCFVSFNLYVTPLTLFAIPLAFKKIPLNKILKPYVLTIANNDLPNSNQELIGRATKRMAKTADKPFREKHFKKGSRNEGDLDYGQIKDGKI
jgi:hypothetical protein